MSTPDATIVITSLNRKEVLRNAIVSALEQEGDYQIIVIDDASTDGTPEMVRSEFPLVELEAGTERRGLIAQRNRGARRAKGPIVVNLDDDIVLPTPDVMRKTLASFDHPRIGAVAIPHINIIGDRREPWFPALPDPDRRWVTRTFAGGAAALRRDVFLGLGGFHEYLFHWGEEGDYCQRMLNAGMVVRVANCTPIHHHLVQVGRHSKARNIYLQRNSLLNHWYNAPTLLLPGLLAREMFMAVAEAARMRTLLPIESVGRGWAGCIHEWRERHPVRLSVFRLFLELRKHKLMPLDEIESLLPPLAVPTAEAEASRA